LVGSIHAAQITIKKKPELHQHQMLGLSNHLLKITNLATIGNKT
jgi:hypothetical protein